MLLQYYINFLGVKLMINTEFKKKLLNHKTEVYRAAEIIKKLLKKTDKLYTYFEKLNDKEEKMIVDLKKKGIRGKDFENKKIIIIKKCDSEKEEVFLAILKLCMKAEKIKKDLQRKQESFLKERKNLFKV